MYRVRTLAFRVLGLLLQLCLFGSNKADIDALLPCNSTALRQQRRSSRSSRTTSSTSSSSSSSSSSRRSGSSSRSQSKGSIVV